VLVRPYCGLRFPVLVQHVEKNPLHEWKEEVEFSSLRVKGYEVNDIAVFLRVEYAKGLHFHVEFFLI
jgi:hypothetical protein